MVGNVNSGYWLHDQDWTVVNYAARHACLRGSRAGEVNQVARPVDLETGQATGRVAFINHANRSEHLHQGATEP